MARGRDSGIEITGLSKAIKALEQLGVEVQDLKDAFAVIGDEAKSQAIKFAPRRSGALISSIKVSKAKNRVSLRAGSARVKYVAVNNYGWPRRNISGSHFMQKADLAVRPMVIPTLEAELGKLIEELGL